MFNKFHAKKTIYNGVTYDSKKEANRAYYLHILELAGKVTNLERQKRFELQEKYTNNKGEKIRAIEYIADFFYFDTEKRQWIVEDVKSEITKKLETYKIKKKIFEYKYPEYTFQEI